MIQVNLKAVGIRSNESFNSRPELLGAARLWTAVYKYGDAEAAEHARLTALQEQSLRSLAVKKHKQIEERTFPTLFHKVAAAIDVVEPRIPENYLSLILFGAEEEFFNDRTNRLPVDIRVAALDYWDQRKRFLSL